MREIVEALAMAHPDVAVKLENDGRTVLDLPAKQLPKRRALDLMGGELEKELLELSADSGNGPDRVKVWGMIGRPDIARATSRHIMMFVNGRRINDRTIHHALKEAYRGLIEPIRHPTAVLFIVLDPALVDVNVHPTKAEVRFRRQAQVHGLIRSSVRQRLIDADLMPMVQFPAGRHCNAGSINVSSLQGSPAPELETAHNSVAGLGMGAITRAGNFGGGAQDTIRPQIPEFGAGNVRELDDIGRRAIPPAQFIEFFNRLDPKQKGFVYTEVKEALQREPAFAELMRHEAQTENNDNKNFVGGSAGAVNSEAGELPAFWQRSGPCRCIPVSSSCRTSRVWSSSINTRCTSGSCSRN